MKERIYELILERRYFRISDITEELWKEYGEIFPRSFIREKVKSFVEVMVGQGLLNVLTDYDPPIFENPIAKEDRPLEELLRKCPVCGKDFFPKRGKQDVYCSAKCREKARAKRRKVQVRKNVRRYYRSSLPTAVNHGNPWSEEELAFLKENYGELTQREIAQRLGRTVPAVKAKVKELGLSKNIRQEV